MFRLDLCYTPWLTATADRWFGTNPGWDPGDWFACCRRDYALVRTEGRPCSIHGLDAMTC